MSKQTLYKYRNFNDDFHLDILFKNEIYFSKISELNDPFDSRITFDFKNLTQRELDYYFEKLKHNNYQKESKETMDSFRTFLFSQRKEYLVLLNQSEESLFEKIVGIFSSSLKWNSLLMWSHYAKNHSGFVVGFNEEILRASINVNHSEKVSYVNNRRFPRLNPMEDDKSTFLKRFFIKSSNWSYEKEYRLLKQFSGNNSQRNIQFPISAIKEVILGFNISETHQNQVLKFCKKEKIKVYKTVIIPFEFNIRRYRIK